MTAIQKDSPGAGDVHVDGTDWKSKAPHARKPRDKSGAEITKSAPAPLYVYRQLLNADEVIAWAKAQGFTTTLPADDMHVTVTYSKAPVDWMAMGDSWSGDEKGHVTVSPGGPRVISQFNQGAVVLEFACDTFAWRNTVMREKGASYDWPTYSPHVTLSYQADGVDLEKVEPYRGKLVFGPEIFQEIKQSFDPDSLVEKSFGTFFKVSGVDEELGLVFGWGIVCKDESGADYRDSQDNHIPEAAMVHATTDFMKTERMAGEMHTRMDAGTILHSFPLTGDIAKAMGIETKKTGWMIAMAPDPAMLAKFADGTFTGFSIGGEHIEIDGKPIARAA